jgi:hypothetical protein
VDLDVQDFLPVAYNALAKDTDIQSNDGGALPVVDAAAAAPTQRRSQLELALDRGAQCSNGQFKPSARTTTSVAAAA